MTAAERERKWPNVVPRDAATLILIDRAGKKPKVLLGKRHANHKFMPGKFVFPGGRIEAGDRSMTVAGALPAIVEQRLMKRVTRPTASRARALALASIRETFEETGLLIGTKEFGAPDEAPAGPWRDFAAHGVFPTLDRMHFVARAITPPRRPKRFDTRFFAVDAIDVAHKVAGVVTADTELVELVWMGIEETRALDLPAITRAILKELAHRIDLGFAETLPVPFYFERRQVFQREEL
ncbi:MAG: NUDIX hydrolase [Rhizobiales bacterium]|nr:NUDIX hydrolase [Hyphomicrobiales bacterium]